MNPYPTRDQLDREQYAEDLLDEQYEATTLLLSILRHTRRQIAGLLFPLGCPVNGFDHSDLTAQLSDWIDGVKVSDPALTAIARDLSEELW